MKNKIKSFKIKLPKNLEISIEYNVFLDTELQRVYAKYPNNLTLNDPFLIALTLFEYEMNSIEIYKEQLSKKVLQYFKDKIPYYEIFYTLTGGKDVWKELNMPNSIIKFWKDDLDEILSDCISIYDLILVFKYFKYEIIKKRLNYLNKIINSNDETN